MTKEIRAKATAGVYSEVMNQIYDSFDKRIREAVSNACDAKATRVTVSVFFGREPKIIIYDNGLGMTAQDIEEKLVSMGGGDKYNNEESIGRIGIGALSVFAIGNEIAIRTRTQDAKTVTIAELSFRELQRASRHSAPLEEIVLGEIKGERTATDKDASHFTEITISDIQKGVLDIFNDDGNTKLLIETLERVLPVPYRGDDAIWQQLPSEIHKQLTSDKHIVEVALHIPHLGYENPDYLIRRKTIASVGETRVANYIPIYPFTLEGGVNSGLSVCGYLFINDGKVLPKRWQGVNARVKNVTIESNTYFEYDDDPASRNRIGGELIISDIDENRAITTNRSGFAKENSDYILVSNYMQEHLKATAAIVRRHSAIDSVVKKYVNAIERLQSCFHDNAVVQHKRQDGQAFKMLDDTAIQVEEKTDFSLNDSLRDAFADMRVEFELIWSGTLEKNYSIIPQEDQFYSIYVQESMRKCACDVAGYTVNYSIGYYGDTKPLLIKKPGEVILNLDNHSVPDKEITRVDVGLVGTLLTLYLNYLRCGGDATTLYSQTIEDLSN